MSQTWTSALGGETLSNQQRTEPQQFPLKALEGGPNSVLFLGKEGDERSLSATGSAR